MVERAKLLSAERVRLGPAVAEAVRVLARHWVGFLVLGVLLCLPLELLGAQLQADNPNLPQSGAPVGTDAVYGVIYLEPIYADILVFAIAVPLIVGTAAIVTAAAQLERDLDVRSGLQAAVGRLPQLLAISLVVALAFALVAAIGAILDAVIADPLPTGSISDVVSAMVLVTGWVLVGVLAVAGYAVASLEDAGPLAVVRRTFHLIRESFIPWLGRSLAILVGASLVAAIVRFVVMQVVRMIEKGTVVEAIGETVADVLFLPLVGAAAAMTYLDIRGRVEGEAFGREELRRDLP